MLHKTDELMRDFVIRDMQVVIDVYRIIEDHIMMGSKKVVFGIKGLISYGKKIW